MEKTPNALRKHLVLLGSTNAGKSTLFNALTGQDGSIVSKQPGTTTDPVRAAMELIPFGPVVLVDTAGLGDESELGKARMKKTAMAARRADAAIFVADAAAFDSAAYKAFCGQGLDHVLVFTKCDLAPADTLERLRENYPTAVFHYPGADLTGLRACLSALLSRQQPDDDSLIGDLVRPGGTVLLVTPIDSEAPKGRMILPQVQALRDCLDNGLHCMVCREFELESALKNLREVDLVITDSQAFAYVEKRLPANMPLTSFSMLLARQKGNFQQLLEGADAFDSIGDGARILVLEGCTHNHTHEDIGRVKIPGMLRKKTGKQLEFDFCSGYDFPEDLSPYAAAVQCGCCMINKREVSSRLSAMAAAGLPVSNYGILLAWGSGILERCCEPFRREVTV